MNLPATRFPFLQLGSDAYRSDGMLKSAVGWKGAIKNNVTGKTMTELSIGAPNTEEGFYPLINPYTTDEQIEFIKNNNFEGRTKELGKTKIGKAMLDNARKHYEESLEKGVSPFNNFYTYENPLGLMNFEQNNNQNLLNMPLIPPVNSIIKRKIKKKKRKRKND